MAVPLLLETLEDLLQKDLKKFKWWLVNGGVLDGCKPIPLCRLEDADRMDTVREMKQHYGEDTAVNLAVEILKKMYNNDAAEKLKKKYAGGETSAASTSTSAAAPPAAAPPAAATMTAQQDGVIIAPTVAGATIETLNINFNQR